MKKIIAFLWSPYRTIPRDLWFSSSGVFVHFCATTTNTFIVLVLSALYTLSPEAIGVFLAVQGIIGLVGLVASSYIIKVLRPKKTIVLSCCMSGLAYALCYELSSIVATVSVLLVITIFRSVFRPSYNSIVLDICSVDEQTKAYALFVVVINASLSISAIVGSYFFAIDPAALFLIDSILLIGASILYCFSLPKDNYESAIERAQDGNRIKGKNPLLDRGFLFVGLLYFIIELVELQVPLTMPFFLKENYESAPQIWGWMMSILGMMIMLFSVPISNSVKRISRRVVIGVAGGMMCFSLYFLANTKSIGMLWTIWPVYIVGQIAIYPTLMGLLMRRANEFDNKEQFIAYYYAISSIARLISLPMAGWVIQNVGPSGNLILCGLLGVAFIAINIVWCNRVFRE